MNDATDQYYSGAGNYDREAVRFFDVAHEGAQLRAIAGAAHILSDLYGMQPRSVIIVATDQIAHAAARYAVHQRTPLRFPVVVTHALPTYVGPLDAVLVVGDVADNDDVSRALITAGQRGAEVILAGPASGPVLDDAPSATRILPSLPTSAGASPARAIGAVCAVLDCLEEDIQLVTQLLNDLADDIDEEIQQLSPERDLTVNPARQLRDFVAGARVIHTATGQPGLAVAELVATVWSVRSIPSSFVSPAELPRVLEEAPAAKDIFHDPFLDDSPQVVPLKAVVWDQEEAHLPNARAEYCPVAGVGETAAALRLVVRGLAVTALDDHDSTR